jgi:C1A family cysteine protease
MDTRDYRYVAPNIQLPPVKDIAHLLPDAWHQGSLGSCSAHAGSALITWLYQGYKPSRLALYYYARVLEDHQSKDCGVSLRSVMKTLAKIGAWPEDAWPYDVAKFDQGPPPNYYAADHKIARYARLLSELDMLSCIASGVPFALGIELPDYFDDADIASHGIFRMPDGKVTSLGRHAITVVGYDLKFKSNPDFIDSGVDPASVAEIALKCRNSWGMDWGLNGHFWLPLPHAVNPSTGGDAWMCHKLISHITEPGGPMVGGINIEGHYA